MIKQLGNLWYLFYILLVAGAYALSLYLPISFIYVPLVLAFIPIAYKALQKMIHKKISTELFLSIATVISIISHHEKAMVIVLLIMLIAQYLEYLTFLRMQSALKSLMQLVPQQATIKVDGQELIIPLTQLTPGMHVIVKTGVRIPVDGIIVAGSGVINESALTGESTPQEKMVPQEVYAGTFVESGSIIIKAEKIGKDTFFGKILELVQSAEQKKAQIVVVADKIATYLVPAMLCFIGIIWLITKNLNVVTTLFVFGSPLELTFITPLALLSGIIAAFRNGILVKGGVALEKLAHADTIFFDKTGTLTMGESRVAHVESLSDIHSPTQILKIAAIAEKRSEHVLAQAIVKKAQEEDIAVPDPEHYVSVSGHGVEIEYQNERCFLGNQHFIQAPEHGNIPIPDEIIKNEPRQYSIFYVGCSGKLYGRILITDAIRENARETIQNLQNLGFKNISILSGDRQVVAEQIGHVLGVSHAYGEVFPDQKLQMIEDLQKNGHVVVMVGDGINDAPALKQADIGIAMGARGIEPAIEAADIVLVTNDLSKIVFARLLSNKIFSIIRQNLIFGFAFVHVIGIILALFGFINPLGAAFFHGISDVLILLNSIRLINFKQKL